MATDLTVGNLLKGGLVTAEEVQASVEAALVPPAPKLVPLGNAYHINVARIAHSAAFVGRILRDREASEGLKRAALRRAILAASAQKG
ncbi:hypothetical protein MOX02_45280 [Methylobacterium oxalidis]|nr:hypothetical protein MOX02_45280 [Methylobacterium oxalidis]